MTGKPKKKNIPLRLCLKGEVTIYTAVSMKPSIMEALNKRKALEIDLAKVCEIDSAGFQLLLLAKREADRKNVPLRLINHSGAVAEMLDLYNMNGHFGDPVVPSKTGDRI